MSTTNEPVQLELIPPAQPKYLIDTNCLIAPYNSYYAPTFTLAQAFWNRLKELTERGIVGVLDKVRDETYGGRDSDQLDDWLDGIERYVIDSDSDAGIVDGFQQVIRTIGNSSNGYQRQAIRDWDDAAIADPWLIGAAIRFQSTIITFEKSQNMNDRPWKHLKIPTVAKMLNVQCVDLFTFMGSVSGF